MRKGAVGALLAVALILPGCSADPGSDYSADTAITLQTQVLDITVAAAAGDPALAMMRLNELAAMANDALVRGQITEARRDSILSAILLVQTDLEKALDAAELRAEEAARAAEDDTSGETVSNDEGSNDEGGGGVEAGPENDSDGSHDGGGASADGGDDPGNEGDPGSEGDPDGDGDAGDDGGSGDDAEVGGGRGDDGKGEEKSRNSNSARGGNNPGRGKKLGLDD